MVGMRILKEIEYPPVATTLAREQCKKIQKPLTAATKKTLGLQKKLSTEIIYRLIGEMGLNMQEVHNIQGSRQLM